MVISFCSIKNKNPLENSVHVIKTLVSKNTGKNRFHMTNDSFTFYYESLDLTLKCVIPFWPSVSYSGGQNAGWGKICLATKSKAIVFQDEIKLFAFSGASKIIIEMP